MENAWHPVVYSSTNVPVYYEHIPIQPFHHASSPLYMPYHRYARSATCMYGTGKCKHPQAIKRNGQRHRLCEFHRQRANLNQLRLDRRRRRERKTPEDRHPASGSDDTSPRSIEDFHVYFGNPLPVYWSDVSKSDQEDMMTVHPDGLEEDCEVLFDAIAAIATIDVDALNLTVQSHFVQA
ncbi:hypothetical protein Poli38472_006807 [Pythium oligandrum]|uniref:Uncharacterized protein n=1 Tax=Pythium oligandrum TaxID=41045 RepID=A0A8K1C5B2_PYTOL|nr:hypothetical protein Poli38472_006807 [Pythium oligandrum]|eukprot:TMW56797.1 hypothetical protein Poli38472_006807 [Pythium oligandrum]